MKVTFVLRIKLKNEGDSETILPPEAVEQISIRVNDDKEEIFDPINSVITEGSKAGWGDFTAFTRRATFDAMHFSRSEDLDECWNPPFDKYTLELLVELTSFPLSGGRFVRFNLQTSTRRSLLLSIKEETAEDMLEFNIGYALTQAA